MKRTPLRMGLVVPLFIATIVAVASDPASAAGYDSVTEALLRNLHRKLLFVAIPLAVLVEIALFYAAIKFHDNDDPKPTKDNRRLEITWTVAVAVILLFVGASSYIVLANPMVSDLPNSSQSGNGTQANTVNVRIVGQNWFWTFSYPGENVTTKNTLVIPTNRTINFTITSKDVIHSVHIPSLGVKQDAFPGRTNTFTTRVTNTGTYRLYCAEFCGTGHSKMLATVKVVSPEEYRQWLNQQRSSGGGTRNATENTTVAETASVSHL